MSSQMQKAQLKSELAYMKQLFFENLPIGDKTEKIEKYFSLLEEAISTTDNVQREEFPPDDPAISGSRVYKYHSSAQFAKLAGGHQHVTSGQDLDNTEAKQEIIPTIKSIPDEFPNMARIQEHSK